MIEFDEKRALSGDPLLIQDDDYQIKHEGKLVYISQKRSNYCAECYLVVSKDIQENECVRWFAKNSLSMKPKKKKVFIGIDKIQTFVYSYDTTLAYCSLDSYEEDISLEERERFKIYEIEIEE